MCCKTALETAKILGIVLVLLSMSVCVSGDPQVILSIKLWMLSSAEKYFFSNCKYFFFFHCYVFLPEQCFSALGAHAKICGNERKKIRAWTNLALFFLIICPHSKVTQDARILSYTDFSGPQKRASQGITVLDFGYRIS